jgi:hypothetical protein
MPNTAIIGLDLDISKIEAKLKRLGISAKQAATQAGTAPSVVSPALSKPAALGGSAAAVDAASLKAERARTGELAKQQGYWQRIIQYQAQSGKITPAQEKRALTKLEQATGPLIPLGNSKDAKASVAAYAAANNISPQEAARLNRRASDGGRLAGQVIAGKTSFSASEQNLMKGYAEEAAVSQATVSSKKKKKAAADKGASAEEQTAASEKRIAADTLKRERNVRERLAATTAVNAKLLDPASDLAQKNAADRYQKGRVRAQNEFETNRGFRDEQGKINKDRLKDPNLKADAVKEAEFNADNRRIAALYGRERQAALLDQIKNNKKVRSDIAQEDAMRQARLGVERKAMNEALAANKGALRKDVVAGKVSDKVESTIQGADVSQQLAVNKEYIAAKTRATVASLREAANVDQSLAAEEAYQVATKEAAIAKLKRAAIEATATAAATIETAAETAQAAVQTKIANEQLRFATAEASLNPELLAAKAQRIVAEKKAAQALNAQLAREVALQGGSRFEQAQARQGHYAGNGAAVDAGGLFAGGLLTTIKYAVPSAALFGAYSGLKNSLKAAQELQVTYAKLDAQAESLGKSASLGELKSGLLDIATATGVATTEVADLGFQFQGAFQDTGKTLTETRAAAEAVKITGLSLKETTDAFTAISTSYKDDNIGIRDVTDAAVALGERFGVASKETISFTADLAPLGQQVGFTVKELETLGAVANKYSGRSGSALAEAFGRVLPSIQEKSADFISLFQSTGDEDLAKSISDKLVKGQTGPAFLEMAKAYKSLGQRQQNQLLELLGGRREAQSIIGVLENADELDTSFDTAGKSAAYMSKVSETLSNRMERLKQQMLQLGIALFEGGLGDALGDVISLFAQLASIVGVVSKVFLGMNDIMGGLPVKILTLAAAVKVLMIAMSVGAQTSRKFGLFVRGGVDAAGAQAAGAAAGRTSALLGANGLPLVVPPAGGAGGAAGRLAGLRNLALTTSGGVASGAGGLFGAGSGSFAAGAGAGTALPIAALALIATKVVTDRYASVKQGVDEAEETLAAKMKTATMAQLEGIAETNTNFWERVGARLFGKDLPEEMARAQIGVNLGKQFGPKAAALGNDETLRNTFVKNLAPGRIGALEEFFNQGGGPVDLFRELDLGTVDKDVGLFGDVTYKTQLDPEKLAAALPKIKELADKGDQAAGFILENVDAILAQDANMFEINRILNEMVASGNVQEAIDAAGGAVNFVSLQLEQAKQQKDSGTISTSQYLGALQTNIDTLKAQIANNPGDIESIIKLAQLEQEQKTIAGERAKSAISLTERMLEIGGDAPEKINDAINEALNGKYGPLTQEDRFALADQAISVLQQQLDDEVASIQDPVEAVRRAKEGIKLPEALRKIKIEEQIVNDPNFDKFVGEIAQYSGIAIDDVVKEVAQIILETDASTQEAMLQLIDIKLEQMKTAYGTMLGVGVSGAQADALGNQITALENARVAIVNLGNFGEGVGSSTPNRVTSTGPDPQEAADKAAEEAIAARKAYFDYLKVLANGDPIKIAQIEAQAAQYDLSVAKTEAERIQAQAAIVSAQQSLRDAEIAKTNALLDVYAAGLSGDPVKSAEIAIAKANYAIQNAKGEADRLNAIASKIQADRALQDAIFAIYAAQSNFLQAQAEYIGDTVRAAEIGLAEANRKLQEVQFKYAQGAAGKADLISAKADVIRATAAARDARISKLEDDYAFAYEMGQITKSQYIQYLEGLKSLADGNTTIIRDLDRQIKSLKDELGADNQFNLPTNIGLPTLYESRRLNQSGTGGYQDNRNVNIVVNVATGTDANQVAGIINDALGTDRFGTVPRRY